MKNHVISNNEVILSIGMIVKNEEKVLRRCLESLKPLMSEIRCELIIADTGSTDNTVEIAKEYTENVFHFEWINDFAAARNSTIDKSNGEWYFFIDADEYLDVNIEELLHFFESSESKKFNCGLIKLRNHFNNKKLSYSDIYLPRFHRIRNVDTKVYFEGSIHETIILKAPYKNFNCILHHTGYFYETNESMEKKRDRNMTFMKRELKNNPDDLRLLCHIIECEKDEQNKINYINKAFELLSDNPQHHYRNRLFIHSIKFYSERDDERALELCEEYKAGIEYKKNICTLSVYKIQASIYMNKKKYKDAFKYWNKYLDMYNKYKNDKLNTEDQMFVQIEGLTESEYCNCKTARLLCMYWLERFLDISNEISEYDFASMYDDDFERCLDIIYLITLKTFDFEMLSNIASRNYSGHKMMYLKKVLEKLYYTLSEKKELQCEYVSKVLGKIDSIEFAKFSEIVLNNADIKKINEYIINNSFCLDEILYFSIKNNIDIFEALSVCEYSKIKEFTTKICQERDDFFEYFINYHFSDNYLMNLKYYYWMTDIYVYVVKNYDITDNNAKKEIYSTFVFLISNLVKNIYNSELLNDNDIEVLPSLHKFGYYMIKADELLNCGMNIEYIRCLKKSLNACVQLRNVVEFCIEEFKKNI